MHGGGGFIDCNAIQNNTSVQRTEEKKEFESYSADTPMHTATNRLSR